MRRGRLQPGSRARRGRIPKGGEQATRWTLQTASRLKAFLLTTPLYVPGPAGSERSFLRSNPSAKSEGRAPTRTALPDTSQIPNSFYRIAIMRQRENGPAKRA